VPDANISSQGLTTIACVLKVRLPEQFLLINQLSGFLVPINASSVYQTKVFKMRPIDWIDASSFLGVPCCRLYS